MDGSNRGVAGLKGDMIGDMKPFAAGIAIGGGKAISKEDEGEGEDTSDGTKAEHDEDDEVSEFNETWEAVEAEAAIEAMDDIEARDEDVARDDEVEPIEARDDEDDEARDEEEEARDEEDEEARDEDEEARDEEEEEEASDEDEEAPDDSKADRAVAVVWEGTAVGGSRVEILKVIGPAGLGTGHEDGSVELRPREEEAAASTGLVKKGGVSKLKLVGGFSAFDPDMKEDEEEYIVQSEHVHDEAWRQVSGGLW